jgi:hypothetical protein
LRGPHDEQISAAGAVERDDLALADQPTPGGKALIRLVNLLEARGFEKLANAAVDAAVPDEQLELFRSRVERRLTSSSTRRGRQPARRAPRRGAASGETSSAPDLEADYHSEAEGVAREYMAVGAPAGPPVAGQPQWRSLGPATIPNGQTYNPSVRINVSGRVAAIAVDPHNPAHVLCGGANGGVWESFDRGGSWAPRTDYQATTAIGAITFSPSNPTTVYCGTGEGNWWWWLGVGILRSSDGGTTWGTLCTAPFVGRGFYDLRVDPANANHLVAGVTNGLFVSSNGGVTWAPRRTATTWSVAFGSGETLAACGDGVFRSTDGGTTWAAVSLPGAPASFTRIAVAIAPSNPSVAYAWGASGANAYLWRRAGGTWTAASSLPPGLNISQAWYDWYCAAAPDRDNQIFLGAIEAYRGDLSGATWTWTVISNHTGAGIHPDQHAIAFEPGNPNTIYAGSDGGLFRSPDRGNSWIHCNNGLVISEFEYIAQSVGLSRWLIGGTQDNGTDRWTGSPSWDHVADGDGGYVAVNYSDPTTVFHTYFDMSPEVSHSSGNWGSWTGIAPPVPPGETQPFYPPMRCTDSNGVTVAIGGGALYVSRNNGSAWVRLAFPSSASATAVCVPGADNVYVGVGDGRVFHTSWNGVAWTALTALSTPRAGASVSDLLVSASNASRIWVTYSTVAGGRVYRSDNAGTSWTDCSAGLPSLPVNAIEVDSRNANRVWVAMDRGVSQSLNAGASWADFSNGLPNAYVGDLCFHPHAWVLRAGTRNRGMWEIPVDGWMSAPICGVQFTGSLAANQTQRWFTFNWPATWHVVWTVMPTTIGAAAQITLTVQVQRASAEFVTYWLTVQNLTASPVNFEGRFCILSRY